MQLLFLIINLLALFFISIGDLVFAVFKLFSFILLNLFYLLLYGTRTLITLLSNLMSQARSYISRLTHLNLRPLQKAKRKRGRPRRKSVRSFFPQIGTKLRYFTIGFIFSFLFAFLPITISIFLQELPHPHELVTRQIPQTSKIYDRNGQLLYEIYASQNRTLVSLSDIPPYLKQATLSIEDKNFYTHPGFDISAIIRAFKENNGAGRVLQGGSTITQQLIKSSMLSSEKSITRKAKELILAFWAERIYSKDELLEMYFNQVPYGGTAWGVGAASEIYFNKNVKTLTLAQSAFLAGLTASPSRYSPYSLNPDLWKKRQKEVLSRMVSLGYITREQANKASMEKLVFAKNQSAFHAPHFVNYVRDLLIKKYGIAIVEKGGLQVKTSLDLKLQNNVEQIVKDEVLKNAHLNLTNGAAVISDPKNGDILTMVGSKDFNDPQGGNVNIATSLRQPGSTVKVITYSAALSNGFTAASIVSDTPTTFSQASGVPYTPVNYDGKFHGQLPLRIAFANSFNIPAVKTLQQIGIPTMVRLARDMGISSWDPEGHYGLSLTLGSAEVTMLDMATVNGTLANQGRRVDLNPILKITNYKGDVLEEKHFDAGRQILQPGVAYIISDILADNAARSMEFGSNSPLHILGHTVSVKTGTTDNKRDNWTNGFTPDFVVSTWVGNNDNSPMSQTLASGITGAAPIWNRIMTLLIGNKPDRKQPLPSDIVSIPCNGRIEYFIRGTEKNASCRAYPITPQPTKP